MGRENHAKDALAATQGEGDEAALKAENASLQDRLLRALADAENTRRRAAQSAEAARQRTIADVVLEMLPILDNLQRAIAAASDRASEPTGSVSVTDGVRATEAMLLTALKRFGVRKVESVGAAFDPSLHDAILEQDPSSQPPGTIIGVIEDGYTIGDRLLRPARVIVAGRSSNRATPSDSAKPQTAAANNMSDGEP
jgi:molecular chaperone GrpE